MAQRRVRKQLHHDADFRTEALHGLGFHVSGGFEFSD